MSVIPKQLKNAKFEYNEDSKQFTIEDAEGNCVVLNKIYAFALMRFVIRMAQRNWLRSNKTIEEIIEDEESFEEHKPSQMELF